MSLAITVLGWERLFRRTADAFDDRIAPLSEVMSPEIVSEITVRPRASNGAGDMKGILDDVPARCLDRPDSAEPMIAKVMALIDPDDVIDVAAAAVRLNVDDETLRRIAKRYFGFPPRLLMMHPDQVNYDAVTLAYLDSVIHA